MIGSQKTWNNYQGMETVTSRTYIWPSEKFYHQVDPLAMDLYTHTYNMFKGTYKNAATEYMISYCDGKRPPIPKSVLLNPNSVGKLPPIDKNSTKPEEDNIKIQSKTSTPYVETDEEQHPHIQMSPIKTKGTSTRRLPLSTVKPRRRPRPVTPDLHPVDVTYTKYSVLRENDWKARHPIHDDDYYEHHKIMDAWRDNITSLFNGNQGYVASSEYSKSYTDPWVLKKKLAVSRFE